ncbi:MAG: hypothetical protein GWN87_26685, partial [Desulfuromonadales bacterium]|nr:hypothetical protein [Desulfuromonadales bacterium]
VLPTDPETGRLAVVFPRKTEQLKHFYEGSATLIGDIGIGDAVPPGAIRSLEKFTYDAYGNVAIYTFQGDPADAGDDVSAGIDYDYKAAAWIMNRPQTITVKGGDGGILRRRVGEYDERGNLTAHRALIGEGEWAETAIDYNPNGTIQKVTGPANAAGER